jgi:hypothetical protein
MRSAYHRVRHISLARSTAALAIKGDIVNPPPGESGYRQAKLEDMTTVFSKAKGCGVKQTNAGDNCEQIAAAQG